MNRLTSSVSVLSCLLERLADPAVHHLAPGGDGEPSNGLVLLVSASRPSFTMRPRSAATFFECMRLASWGSVEGRLVGPRIVTRLSVTTVSSRG